jgi:hypothetical protein
MALAMNLRPEYPPSNAAQALAQAIARLPQSARAKYQRLIGESEDTNALVGTVLERRKLAETRAVQATERARSTDPKYEAPQRIQAISDELEAARAALAEVDTALGLRNQQQAKAAQIVAQLRHFLTVEMRGPIRATNSRATPRKGESLQDAILRVRSELGTAQTELAQVKAAPPTRAEIEQQLIDHIQQLKNQGVPRWTLDSNNKVIVHWPDTSEFSVTGTFPAPSGGASRLLCHLFPDAMFAALTDGLDQWPEGLTAGERERRTQQLEHRILHLELSEEQLVDQAFASGVTVDRVWRSGWSVLGIEPDKMMEAQAAE